MQRCRSLLQTHSKSSKVIVLLYQEMLRFMKNKTLRNYVNKQKLDEASLTSYFTNLEFGFNLTLFFEVHLGLGNELDPRKEKQTKRKKERKKERKDDYVWIQKFIRAKVRCGRSEIYISLKCLRQRWEV